MILFDTGPIVAAAAENDEHFHTSSQLFTGLRLAARRLVLPATVSAEVGYLLTERVNPEMEVQFLRGVADGAFELVDLTRADYRRMAELTEQYIDMPLGTTDASVIALAERLGITETQHWTDGTSPRSVLVTSRRSRCCPKGSERVQSSPRR